MKNRVACCSIATRYVEISRSFSFGLNYDYSFTYEAGVGQDRKLPETECKQEAKITVLTFF